MHEKIISEIFAGGALFSDWEHIYVRKFSYGRNTSYFDPSLSSSIDSLTLGYTEYLGFGLADGAINLILTLRLKDSLGLQNLKGSGIPHVIFVI